MMAIIYVVLEYFKNSLIIPKATLFNIYSKSNASGF